MKKNDLAQALIKKETEEQTKSLDLGFCGLAQIPEEVFEMTWLEELNLGNYIWQEEKGVWEKSSNKGAANKLSFIPTGISKLKNLKVLRLSGYDKKHSYQKWNIDNIPPNSLPHSLAYLDISFNCISKIINLEQLINLNSLDLTDNNIVEISGLETLVALKRLDINGNQILEIKALGALIQLSSLNISENQISEIKGLDALTQLSSLYIGRNQITEIKGLNTLTKLSLLDFTGNQISEIKGLDALTQLSSLNISYNQISEIKGLDTLTKLSSLNISYNQISEIKELVALTQLSSLNISYNQISEIKGLDTLTKLNSLDIIRNQISEIKGLDALIQLNSLDFNDNQVSEIKGLDALTQLSSLNIRNNQISEIRGLDTLAQLSSLNISHNQVSEIKGLNALTQLSSFYISSNQISEIKGLDALTQLSSFYISSNKISEIKGLDALTKLSLLDFSDNQITEIKGLNALTQLSSFNISFNEISEIKGLDALTQLSSLYISRNQISEIKGLNALTQLNSLDISSNQISEIKGLDVLTQLSSFYINNNQISEIKGLDALIQLSSIDINSNQISEIKGLDALTQLNSLGIYNNKISEIKGLDALTQLSSLDMDKNQISEIKGLDALTQLNTLDISRNQISEIKGLDALTQLNYLRISNNLLVSSKYLQQFQLLFEIVLYNNPLKDVPQGLLRNDDNINCLPDLQSWWKETADTQNTKANTLIKLQVTGNGNAGKSSVIEALKNGRCDIDFESTHGVLIELLNYDTNSGNYNFQAWDFGGQEIYHGTHKLFISSESIILIVADAESEKLAVKGEAVPDRVNAEELVLHQPLEHYIELARKQSPSSIIIVVENKADTKDPNDNSLYKKVAKENLKFYEISAKKGIGIQQLRIELAEKSKGLLHYGMLMPKSWLDVQQYFLNNLDMPEADRRKIMSHKGFESVCAQCKVMKGSESSLLKLLHHTGLIYVNEQNLKDTIITDQRWALDAIYKPLDRKSDFYDSLHKDYRGRVRVKQIFNAFGNNYTTDQKWLFIRFMQSCGLCFSINTRQQEETEDSYFIFPKFLPETETPAVHDLWKAAKSVRSYRYTLDYHDYYRIQKFIVDIGKKTKVEYIWRYGILVQTAYGMFRLETDRNKPALVLHIESSAEDAFLWEIVSTFLDGDSSMVNNQWFNHSDGKTEILDIDSLRKKADESRNSSGSKNNNSKKIHNEPEEQVLQNEKKGLKENLKDIEQIIPKRLVISYASEDLTALEDLKETLMPLQSNGSIQFLYDKKIVNGKRQFSPQLTEMFEDADGYIILVSRKYQNEELKDYIWQNEFPVMERRHREQQISIDLLPVSPVYFNDKLKGYHSFRPGDKPLPAVGGHERDDYLLKFMEEVILNQFLKK